MTEQSDRVALALGALAEELRHTVEGVVGTANLLFDTELTDEQREYAASIRRRTDGLLTTLNDVVDLARIKAGTLPLENVDFDLRIMFAGIMTGFADRARELGLDLQSSVDPELPSLVRGDPGRLRQVLSNLLQGALERTKRGQVEVRAVLAREEEQQVRLRLEVQLPAARAPRAGQAKPGGAERGMRIAQGLAKLLGGGVELEEGVHRLTVQLERQPQPEPAVTRGTIRGERVLVVSESASRRANLTRLLAEWGCLSDEAGGARECLDLLRAAVGQGAPFATALIEPSGRGLDAEALGQAIKRELAIAETALVLLAAAGRRGDAARLRALGFDAFLPRPVEPSHLQGCLVTLSARRCGPERPTSGIITRHTLVEERKREVRLLLVEANHINRKVALKLLTRLGYVVDAVADGAAALQALGASPYEILLLDQELTEPSGEEVVRVIRDPDSDVLDHNIPIVAMTAHAAEGALERCQPAGMDDLITKPMHPKRLQEAIERQLPAWARPGAEPAQGESTVIDRRKLLERLSGDVLLLDEVLGEFLGAAPPLVESLREALGRGDLATLERQAYTLKGAAANVSAEALRSLSHRVEAAAREGHAEQAGPLVDRIAHELHRLRQALGAS